MGRLAFGCVFVSAAFACGGRTPLDNGTDAPAPTPSAESSDGGNDTGNPEPAGDDGPLNVDFGVCPPQRPETETPCNVPGLGCAYGMGTPMCQAFLCNEAGFWQATTQGCG
jgi:hypothetical protein